MGRAVLGLVEEGPAAVAAGLEAVQLPSSIAVTTTPTSRPVSPSNPRAAGSSVGEPPASKATVSPPPWASVERVERGLVPRPVPVRGQEGAEHLAQLAGPTQLSRCELRPARNEPPLVRGRKRPRIVEPLPTVLEVAVFTNDCTSRSGGGAAFGMS